MNSFIINFLLSSVTFEYPVDRNVGLKVNLVHAEMDLQAGGFYMTVSSPVSLIAATLGDSFAGTFGAGFTSELGRNGSGYWKIDGMVVVSPGKFSVLNFVNAGIALGFRYEHYSGFCLGFKLPLIGYMINTSIGGKNETVNALSYYLVSLFTLPFFTLGYRF